MSQRVYDHFQSSVEAKMQVGEALAPQIEYAAEVIVHALLDECKVMACGQGASAALGQIFTTTLLDRFEKERPALPALWLGNNYLDGAAPENADNIFAKPIRALARMGDVLLVLSALEPPPSVRQAITTAQEMGVSVIVLSGAWGAPPTPAQEQGIIQIAAEVNSISRVHEIHLLVLYCLCDLIDHKLFGIE